MSIDVSTYAHEYKCLWMLEDDADFPGDGIAVGLCNFALLLNSYSWKEQQTLLALETSFSVHIC